MELHDAMVQKMLNGTPMEFDSDLEKVEFERDSWIRRACSAEKVLGQTSATVTAQEKTISKQAERIAELEKKLKRRHTVQGLYDALKTVFLEMTPAEHVMAGVGATMLMTFMVSLIMSAIVMLR